MRAALLLACAAGALQLAPMRAPATPGAPRPSVDVGQSWALGRFAFSLLPLTGTERRKTVEAEIIRGRMWTHDQLQGVVNVNVPVRQTVVKLESGGLWVHNPVAPTGECVALMRALEAEHGPVKVIVMGTVALEHKATAGPFCRCFPNAEVWVQPGQWSFPLPLPLAAFGFPTNTKTLPALSADEDPNPERRPEWESEIGFEVLGPLKFKAVGAFGETAFFHKKSRTLIVTDAVVAVEPTPPPILQEDPRALLFHARDGIEEEVYDSPSTRAAGWRRICLFGLTFFPSDIEVHTPSTFSRRLRGARTQPQLGEESIHQF